MPRETIETACNVEHLSVLDAEGNVDQELEPEVSDDMLRRIHEKMVLSRRFDERMLKLQRAGQIGTFAPVSGQEATQLGSVAALNGNDWVVPSYREIGTYVWRELPLSGMLMYNAGYNEGGRVPDEQNYLPTAIPVASQILHAVGVGYARKLQRSEEVAMVFFGDGATSSGDFHEALNFARVFCSPTVFICENNQYAISVPRSKQTRSKTLAQKAFAYDVPCIQVDGNDVLAVLAASRSAVKRAREESMPTLIECMTYRLSVHTTVDDPSQYRSESEVEEWQKYDPIKRLRTYLKNKEIVSDDDVQGVEDAVNKQIKQAIEDWKQWMKEADEHPERMFEQHYAEMPPRLQEQRESFKRGLRQQNNSEEQEHG